MNSSLLLARHNPQAACKIKTLRNGQRWRFRSAVGATAPLRSRELHDLNGVKVFHSAPNTPGHVDQ
jgi:alpha-ketoglutarate-dependent taurine dioxygenase